MMGCAVNVLCNSLFLKSYQIESFMVLLNDLNSIKIVSVPLDAGQSPPECRPEMHFQAMTQFRYEEDDSRCGQSQRSSISKTTVGRDEHYVGEGKKKWGYCCIFVEIGPGPKNIPIYFRFIAYFGLFNAIYNYLFLPSRTSIVELLLVLLVLVDCRLPFRRTINS